MCRTNLNTRATQPALLPVTEGEVLLNRDRFKLTLFEAFGATDTGVVARFLGDTAFVFVHAADKYPATLRPFLP